jgi:hypothetical protein
MEEEGVTLVRGAEIQGEEKTAEFVNLPPLVIIARFLKRYCRQKRVKP